MSRMHNFVCFSEILDRSVVDVTYRFETIDAAFDWICDWSDTRLYLEVLQQVASRSRHAHTFDMMVVATFVSSDSSPSYES